MTERALSKVSRLPLLLPWLILVVTLGVTWLVWQHERRDDIRAARIQLDFSLRETVSRVEQRVAAYEQLLRGVQGLFATTALTNRSAFNAYVDTLQWDANFAGIQDIGAIAQVPGSQKDVHVSALRGWGSELRKPDLMRQNPWSDPVRRQAMETARDSGMAAITGMLSAGDGKGVDVQPGFIMYLPLFAPGQPHESVAQRRAQLIGWVYASFHMSDFMASLYGKQAPGVTLAIYDDVNPTDSALLYRADDASADGVAPEGGAISATEYMVVAGHTWTLKLGKQQGFEDPAGRDVASVMAVTGIGLSVSLALLGWVMVTGRARALRLAASMTQELRHMAQHDPLTGLPNRAMFSERLQSELARAERHRGRFSVIFLDLDHFKPINDQYGHAVGDLLLKQVARRLQDAIRASDTVGRIGGDEFVVLLPELAESQTAVGLAEKIRQTVRQPFMVGGHALTISCSLGVAIYPDDGADEIALTKSADEAMYRAKDGGRDSVQLAN